MATTKHTPQSPKKLTMGSMSKKLGITQPALRKWFTGYSSPTLPNLEKLAKHMDCTVDQTIQAMNRTANVYRAKKKLPYGLIIEKDMLLREYKVLLLSENK